MKEFVVVPFDAPRAAAELAAFKELLDAKQELEEAADIKPFFEANRQLAALLGAFHWNNGRWDLVASQ